MTAKKTTTAKATPDERQVTEGINRGYLPPVVRVAVARSGRWMAGVNHLGVVRFDRLAVIPGEAGWYALSPAPGGVVTADIGGGETLTFPAGVQLRDHDIHWLAEEGTSAPPEVVS